MDLLAHLKEVFFFCCCCCFKFNEQFQAWMDQGAQVISSDWRAPRLGSGFFGIGFILKQPE